MLKPKNFVALFLVVTALFAISAPIGAAFGQKADVPKPRDNVALAENEIRQLLLVMETDKNGKISKQEFIKFMQRVFERLDKEQRGELDVRELTKTMLREGSFAKMGK